MRRTTALALCLIAILSTPLPIAAQTRWVEVGSFESFRVLLDTTRIHADGAGVHRVWLRTDVQASRESILTLDRVDCDRLRVQTLESHTSRPGEPMISVTTPADAWLESPPGSKGETILTNACRLLRR